MTGWTAALMLLKSFKPMASASSLPIARRLLLQQSGTTLSQFGRSYGPAARLKLSSQPHLRLLGSASRCFASVPEQSAALAGDNVAPSVPEESLVSDSPAFDSAAAASPVIEQTPLAPGGAQSQEQSATVAAELASANASLQLFLQQWATYTAALSQFGFFRGEEHDISSTEVDQYGVVKRANLNLARERQDLLHSLPQAKIVALTKQKLPYDERKIVNASERLTATFIDHTDLDSGRGGTANTQDLVRLIVGAYYSIRQARRSEQVKSQEPALGHEGFLDAVSDILPDVIRVMSLPPEPEAVAKAEALAQLKEKQSITPPGTRAPFVGRRGDRDPRPQAIPKAGDWECDVCGQHNFAHRVECFRCSAERPESIGPARDFNTLRPGDWTCPECSNVNFARRMECNRCSMPRPPETVPRGGVPSAPSLPDDGRYGSRRTDAAPAGIKHGDWFCPECNAHNFASRRECYQCVAPRPAGAGQARPPLEETDSRYSVRKTDPAGSQGIRQGDWFCPECNQHNYASRNDCFQCGLDRPGASADRSKREDFGRVHPGRDDFARGPSFRRGRGGGGGGSGSGRFSRSGSGSGRGGRQSDDAFGSEPPRGRGYERLDGPDEKDWFNSR